MTTLRARPKYRIQVLDRAVALLEAIAHQSAGATLAQLSRQVGMHRSSVYRLLTVLESHRLVSRNPADGNYALGLRFFELAGRVSSALDLPRRARPYLEKLVVETGETAHVCCLDQHDVLYLEKVEGPRAVRAPSIVGRRYPAHCGAAGKALLAYLSREELDELVAKRGLRAHTRNTLTTPAQLRQELERIRERGYSVDNEEYEEGLKCVGAPIRDYSGKVVASISVAGPAFRMTDDKLPLLAEAVVEAARQVSRELGYREKGAGQESEKEMDRVKVGV